jgi:hypothetical protein
VEGKTYTFGISGKLYKSNVLLYDRRTESLWSQMMEKGVTGPAAGKKLRKLPSVVTSWGNWKERHPDTQVLSTDTGYDRNYGRDPYEDYYRAAGLWFSVGDVREDLEPKTRVMGVEADGKARAYPLKELRKGGTVTDRIGTTEIVIQVASDGEIAAVEDGSGDPVAPVFSFWFAWQAFHPETSVYQAER